MRQAILALLLLPLVAGLWPAAAQAAEKVEPKRKIELQASVQNAEYFTLPMVFDERVKTIRKVTIVLSAGGKKLKSFDLNPEKLKEALVLETPQQGYIEVKATYYLNGGGKAQKSWGLGKYGESGDARVTLVLAPIPATSVYQRADDVTYGLYPEKK